MFPASFLVLISSLLWAFEGQKASGFAPLLNFPKNRKPSSTSTTLFYTDDPPKQEPSLKQPRVLTIPVLAVIPGSKPLMVGEDYVLDSPTPLQWQVLEEAMYTHREYLKQEARRNDGHENNNIAGIDAAPLVAFMDEVTSQRTLRSGDNQNAKYATIAAIVGISSTENKQRGLETSSKMGFMESLMRVFKPDVKVPFNSKIRLVGIGRAALSDFYSRTPSAHYESAQDQYLEISNDGFNPQEEQVTPVLMAQFRLLSDSGERSTQFTKNGRSSNSSPIHALNEMANFANRVTSLHEDRKRLVRGLIAAKGRLAVAASSNDDILEDHDGLGQLSSGFTPASSTISEISQSETQQEIETLLNTFPGTSSDPSNDNAHARLLKLENYGLGISSASFSEIPGLTKALEEKLQPYYSPEKQASEEHYYEVFSFMGVLSLSKFVEPQNLDWALKCTNTIERLEWVYQTMWLHKRLLQDASEEVSAELRDCGEECTDLW